MIIDTQHEDGCPGGNGRCCNHPQTVAASSDADILIYGGAAGSGKSFFLTHDAARGHATEGYGAVVFRRTFGELQGAMSIWEEMGKMYPLFGGESREHPALEWRFPCGALIQAMGLEYDKDVRKHQSKRYAWIGFDELTTFSEDQFWFLVGRAGTMSTLKPVIRGTCNPDADSWVRKLISWYIDEDGYPLPERSGVLRWFLRTLNGDLAWYDSREDALEVCRPGQQPMSLTFVAAKLSDNKLFESRDPSYRAKLEALTPTLRARMLLGNWNAKEGAGDMYQRGWFPRLGADALERRLRGQPTHLDLVRRVRFWDLASTPMQGALVPGIQRPPEFRARIGGDPDWTRGLRASVIRTQGQHRGKIVLEDLKSWRDTPGAIRAGIVQTAKEDGPGTVVGLFLDPGQAGKDQIEVYRKALRGVARVEVFEVTKSKAEYAQQPSQAAFAGKIWVDDPDNVWSGPFFNELEQFPTPKGEGHDDCVDVLTGVWRLLDRLGTGAGLPVEGNPAPKDPFMNEQDATDSDHDDDHQSEVYSAASARRRL